VLQDAKFVAFIPVRDLDVAGDFYVTALGATRVSDSPFAVRPLATGLPGSLTRMATRCR
jgi:catechol 2,3-dioxygenase-like lactoylglutathione lyase family enzyme